MFPQFLKEEILWTKVLRMTGKGKLAKILEQSQGGHFILDYSFFQTIMSS
jgi:hypothetical protein